MKRLFVAALLTLAALTSNAKDYILNTPNTSLILSAKEGETLYFRYYGSKATAADVRAAGRMVKHNAYPAFGTRCDAPYASLVKQHDGDNATKFVVEKIEKVDGNHLSTLSFWLSDVAHPNLVVKVMHH